MLKRTFQCADTTTTKADRCCDVSVVAALSIEVIRYTGHLGIASKHPREELNAVDARLRHG